MIKQRRGRLLAIAAGLAALAGGVLLGRAVIDTPERSGKGGPRDESLEHIREAGFRLSYPASWRRARSPDPDVALVASDGGAASLLVRVLPLPGRKPPSSRSLTERVESEGSGVRLLQGPKRIELGGVRGYFYFYTFEDPVTGRRGAHSHYFLFPAGRLIALVFQALPADRFEALAPTFDRIAATFRAGR